MKRTTLFLQGWMGIFFVALGLLTLTNCSNPRYTATGENETLARQTSTTPTSTIDDYDRLNARDYTIAEMEGLTIPEIEFRSNDRNRVFLLEDVLLFDFDKAQLKPGAENALAEVTRAIKKNYPNGTIVIRGHADTAGSEDYNMQLSKDRAMAVKNWLTENTSLDVNRIQARWYGETQPVVTPSASMSKEDQELNRRVEIWVVNQ